MKIRKARQSEGTEQRTQCTVGRSQQAKEAPRERASSVGSMVKAGRVQRKAHSLRRKAGSGFDSPLSF